MTKLEQAFAEAAQLSQAEQEVLAVWLLEEIHSDRRWVEAFARSDFPAPLCFGGYSADNDNDPILDHR